MRPTLTNIKACFAGTPIEAMVEQDLNFFAEKGIVGKIEGTRGEVLFVMTSAAIDSERMKQKLEETRKEITFEKLQAQKPEEIIRHAVKGMMPKGPLGRQMYKKLKVYAGPEHNHAAQKPETWTW